MTFPAPHTAAASALQESMQACQGLVSTAAPYLLSLAKGGGKEKENV